MYAVIENGVVVGLTETDITALTANLVVSCDNTVELGDLYDGSVFTAGPGPEIEIGVGATVDLYTFSDTDNYGASLAYFAESTTKKGILKIDVVEAVGGGIQWSHQYVGQAFTTVLSSSVNVLRIENQSAEVITLTPIEERVFPK